MWNGGSECLDSKFGFDGQRAESLPISVVLAIVTARREWPIRGCVTAVLDLGCFVGIFVIGLWLRDVYQRRWTVLDGEARTTVLHCGRNCHPSINA